jgi:hypothetical protein
MCLSQASDCNKLIKLLTTKVLLFNLFRFMCKLYLITLQRKLESREYCSSSPEFNTTIEDYYDSSVAHLHVLHYVTDLHLTVLL